MSRWVVDVVSGPPPRTRPPQATVPSPSEPEVDVLAALLPVEALVLDAPVLEEPLFDALPLAPLLDAVAEAPEADVVRTVVPVFPVVEPEDARAPEPEAALDVDATPEWLEGPPPDDAEPHPAIIPSPTTRYPEAARVFAMPSKGKPEPKTAQRSAWRWKVGESG
jgi:hypothetical protein